MTKSTPSPEQLLQALSALAGEHFGVDPPALIDAILRSPNARGYILGAVTEIALADHMEALGYQVKRIKEKWVGPKLHHGDFYVSEDGGDWYVVESKGLKSNAERWMKVAQYPTSRDGIEKKMKRAKGELGRWWARISESRQESIIGSGAFNKARVLSTHFVSGKSGKSKRQQATPLVSEFHIVSVDPFLRLGRHDFLFAASGELEASPKNASHLKQNYLIDLLVPGVDQHPDPASPWHLDLRVVFNGLTNPVSIKDMQVDERPPGRREAEELLNVIESAENDREEDEK